ncbi:MAG: OmpA family protein [Gemmatimonadota bacterium]|nr:OmpA family protein [Gemmatimonadota bacterium]MDH3423040.1 OmpA family protein [Gemmatimonadota bacterium]
MPHRLTRSPLFLLLLLLPLATGCVKRSTYRNAIADAQAVELGLRTDLDAGWQREEGLQADIADLESQVARMEGEIEALQQQRSQLQSRLGLAAEEVHNLEVLLSDQGTEYDQLQARLESLRAVEAEVRERNAIYEDVLRRFRSLIDGGQLGVSIARGRMVIQLPQDVLFASGSATLGAEGRRTLAQVGTVLAELNDRSFQVEGHTDNVPIANAPFASNWELSSARALSVVRVLIDAGVAPTNLSGAGYGEFQPVAPNDDRESRRLNRRIEIVMLPNLDVIAGTEAL